MQKLWIKATYLSAVLNLQLSAFRLQSSPFCLPVLEIKFTKANEDGIE